MKANAIRGDGSVRFRRGVAASFLIIVTLVFGGLIIRLVHINTVLAPQLIAIAQSQHESSTVIPARRGNVFDRRGRLLAGSLLRPSVFADPALIEAPNEVARDVAGCLDADPGEIENAIRTSGAPRFCWLARRVSPEQAAMLRRLDLPGIGLTDEFERYWPMGRTAAQVLGFVGSDGRGLAGVELDFNTHLRGVDGRRSTLRDARRRAIAAGRDGMVSPRDGGHLVLTIDSVIQHIVEQRLAEQVERMNAESGVTLVMSPSTGEILAMACHPTFDPNHYRDASPDLWRNRTLTDPVEPGSIFKPFIAAGALEGNYANLSEHIDCHKGLYMFGNRRMHDTSPHGMMSVRDILVYSSNIGMGILGTRMGNAALYETIRRFGFGVETGVGISGESAGPILPLKQWTSYSTTSVTMGQELAVTPIQVLCAFSSLINGGWLLRPRLVSARLAEDGSVLESFDEPEVIHRAVESQVAEFLLHDALLGVVQRGGREVDASPYQMCGKSGTAQVPYAHRRGYEPNTYLSSYMAAAPADDPQVAVLVMIRRPDPAIAHFGRVVSGPAVRDIVRGALEYLGVEPSGQLFDASGQLAASTDVD